MEIKQDEKYEVGDFLLFVDGKVVAVSGNSDFDDGDSPYEIPGDSTTITVKVLSMT